MSPILGRTVPPVLFCFSSDLAAPIFATAILTAPATDCVHFMLERDRGVASSAASGWIL